MMERETKAFSFRCR